MPYEQVIAGQVIASSTMNTALSQGVLRFANAAERDAAIPSPPDGTMCYLADKAYTMLRRNGQWVYQSGGDNLLYALEVKSSADTYPLQNCTGTTWRFLRNSGNTADLAWTFTNTIGKTNATVTLTGHMNKTGTSTDNDLRIGLYLSDGIGWVRDPKLDGIARVIRFGANVKGTLSFSTIYQLATIGAMDHAIPAGTITAKIGYFFSGANNEANTDYLGVSIMRSGPPQ